ncbi:MAG: class I SAM-dependent methyltransferase [Ktedonobacteraceae bacterium]
MSTENNNYIMGSENAAEMARLINQDLLITHSMGGPFPYWTEAELVTISNLLDIACGPGGWALEVARAFPQMHITGVDISQTMIRYADALADSRGYGNLHFGIMDVTRALDFPDNSFDFANARLLAGFMPKNDWPQFLQECMRVLRPGGIICLTEWEVTITNSPAQEKLNGMLTRAGTTLKRAFSLDGRSVGITPMLGRFLKNAGCTNIHQRAFAIDFSSGTQAHEAYAENVMVGFDILRPLIMRTEQMSDEEYSILHQQMVAEMLADDFCGLAYYLTVWGQKPQ